MKTTYREKLSKTLEGLAEEKERLFAACNALQVGGQHLAELFLKYGEHLPDCNIWEMKKAGRIVNISEAELCSCFFSKNKAHVECAQEGKLTQKDINVLLREYKVKAP